MMSKKSNIFLNKYIIPFDPYVITSVDDSTIYSVALIGEEYRLVEIDTH